MKLAVSGTATDRPVYFDEVLESWSESSLELVDTFTWNMEPVNNQAMLDSAYAWQGAQGHRTDIEVVTNPNVFGALKNPWFALQRAFDKGADFVIVAEDDSVVSTDAIEYFSWVAHTYVDDPDVFVACSFRAGKNDYHCGDPAHIEKRPQWFYATVWGVWRDRWEDEIRGTWDFDYSKRGWDWNMKTVMGDRYCVSPCCSRSQHIGRMGGTHCTPEMFDAVASDVFVRQRGHDTQWRE